MAWVYVLRCSDNTFYVGHCKDVEARVGTHNEGRAGKYTALRRPVVLVYAEEHDTIEAAIARERQLKRWTTAKKEALISGRLDRLRQLSRCRQ